MFRIVFWDVLQCKITVDRRFRGTYCLHNEGWSLKRRSTISLHGSTSQKTILNDRTSFDEWSSRRIGLYRHRITQEHKDKHPCPRGIRTHDPSNQEAELRLRPRSHRDRHANTLLPKIYPKLTNIWFKYYINSSAHVYCLSKINSVTDYTNHIVSMSSLTSTCYNAC
jgi:hypothetical protein